MLRVEAPIPPEVPTPSPTIANTSQTLLYEWMNRFVTLYNGHCDEMDNLNDHQPSVDSEAFRMAVDGAVLTALGEAMVDPRTSLFYFVIKIMKKTWDHIYPFSYRSEFDRFYKVPFDPAIKPPFLRYTDLMGAISGGSRPLEALRELVLRNLEEQFRIGIQEFHAPIPYSEEMSRWGQFHGQAGYEERLAAKKRVLANDIKLEEPVENK